MKTITDEKERAERIFSILKKEYAAAKIALDFENPFQLLIATILSAQCTDARVNIVSKELFKKYKTPKDFISVPQSYHPETATEFPPAQHRLSSFLFQSRESGQRAHDSARRAPLPRSAR